ncbi:MAG: HD-GYP domain-containing protein [Eubacteriales bacterium]|nr:HD-GYP domain-containing protein [Eubacteriales bacterium]
MNEKTIFIFDAEEGMRISQDVILPDGNILVKKGTALDMNLISTISGYHILEINVYDEVAENYDANYSASSSLGESEQYYDKIRNSKEFEIFNESYKANVDMVKQQLNHVVTTGAPIDPDELLKGTMKIVATNTNSLQLFDMLHVMRHMDDLTYVHSINVALISSVIGKLMNYSEEEIKLLTLCGLLHDIGKLLIPDEILNKPGKLTDNEYAIMKKHVNLGYEQLKTQNLDIRIKEVSLLHHEKCDGTGYPFGLKSKDIPACAKIVTIADVYDAMTANRVYRGSICPFEVIDIMQADAFTKYDPIYIIPFLKKVAGSYIHTDVKLSDGRTGKVILINDNALHKPSVLVGNELIDLSKKKDLKIISML